VGRQKVSSGSVLTRGSGVCHHCSRILSKKFLNKNKYDIKPSTTLRYVNNSIATTLKFFSNKFISFLNLINTNFSISYIKEQNKMPMKIMRDQY
jgi:hypothetical protein